MSSHGQRWKCSTDFTMNQSAFRQSTLILLTILLHGCVSTVSPNTAPDGPPFLTHANVFYYPDDILRPRDGVRVLNPSERDVPLTVQPSRRDMQRLLAVTGGSRVEWEYFCTGTNDIDNILAIVPGCRLTDIYPDTPEVREAVGRFSAKMRYTIPARSDGQRPQNIWTSYRVSTSLRMPHRDEPCIALLLCPPAANRPQLPALLPATRITGAETPTLQARGRLAFPNDGGGALDGVEPNVLLQGLPSRRDMRRLLTIARSDRVDWTYHCDLRSHDYQRDVNGCRVTNIYPDTPDVRESVSRLSARVRYRVPWTRTGQRPESFNLGVRVAMSRQRPSWDEPCAVAYLCPRPGAQPPPPPPAVEQGPG